MNYIPSYLYKMKNDKKILILERDRLLGLDIQQQLIKNNFTVIRPLSVENTAEIISNENPDLVIADTDMNDESVFKKIKKQLKKIQLPFIWITSLTKEEAMKNGEGINLIKIFFKTFNSKSFVAFITNYFKKVNAFLYH